MEYSIHGTVPIKVIGILPDGSTGHTVVHCHASSFDGRVTLFAPMIREVAREQLGVPYGQHFQGWTWYPIGDFVAK